MNFVRNISKVRVTMGMAASIVLMLAPMSQAAPKAAAKGNKTPSAQALYAQKNFVAASKAFYKKVIADPSDAESYYYLGNCAVAMKNYPQALEYYKRASDLQPETTIGAYSKTAMGRVNDLLKPPETKSADASKAKVMDEGDDDKSDKKDEKKDPKVIAAEAQGQAKIAEGDKAAQKILDEATNRCRPLKEEEDREVSDMTASQGRAAGSTEANQALADLKASYEDKIKVQMEPARKRAQQIKDAAKKEADAIKQAALAKK